MKKQCHNKGRPWLLRALLGHPSSPRSVTRWVVVVRPVGLRCRYVLAPTASRAAPYPPLVVFPALLGNWGGKLTSNPIVVRAYLYSGVMLETNKNLLAERPGLRTASLAGSSCPRAPCQLRILLGEGGGNRSALNSRSDKAHLVPAASYLPTEGLIVCGCSALGTGGCSASPPRCGWGDPAVKWSLMGDGESSFPNTLMQMYQFDFTLVGKSQDQKELN